KLKRADHRSLTRRQSQREPVQLADTIYRVARSLYDQVPDKGPYRLIGVGIAELVPEAQTGLSGDLLDPMAETRGRAERATDEIRRKFGKDAIMKGRALR
ncbi:DNA polymerase IV, partial [Pseudomonas fluorescens]